MTQGELVFAAILLVAAAALVGLWLSTRTPKTGEEPVELYLQQQLQHPRLQRMPEQKTSPQRPRQKTPSQPQQAQQTDRPKPLGGVETVSRPAGGEAGKVEEGGVESGGAVPEQQAAGGASVEEAEKKLEEVLNLYSSLLQEMERLKQRLGEKLS